MSNDDDDGIDFDSRNISGGNKSDSVVSDAPPAVQKPKHNRILGYSVAIETAVFHSKGGIISGDFTITEPRNIIAVINTEQERWIVQNTDPNLMIMELASHVKSSNPPLKVTPIEMFAIAKEIGEKSEHFKQQKTKQLEKLETQVKRNNP